MIPKSRRTGEVKWVGRQQISKDLRASCVCISRISDNPHAKNDRNIHIMIDFVGVVYVFIYLLVDVFY
jgi:hypothetical protein